MEQSKNLPISETVAQALAARGVTLVRLIASGGMSEVYEGTRKGQRVAVKLLHAASQASQTLVQALVHEAELMQRLRHPDLLEVLDAGQISADAYFIVMPYAAGGTLRQRLAELSAQGKRMSEREALQIAHRVACALEYVHAQGIVHRDVKPSNILFMGAHASAKLADFGVAVEVEAALRAQAGARALVLGTPEYAAPEQAQGRADVRADLYALGIVLYEMLAGAPPFRGKTASETVALHAVAPLPPLGRPVSSRTRAVLARATAKNPLNRFQSAREMRLALEQALAHLPFEQAQRAIGRGMRRVLTPVLSGVGAAVAVALLLLTVLVGALASRLEAHLSADQTWALPPLGVENRVTQSEAQRLVSRALEDATLGAVSASRVALGPANNRVVLELRLLSVGTVEVALLLTAPDGIPSVSITSLGAGRPALISDVLEGAVNRGVLAAWQRHGYRLSAMAITPDGEMIYTLAGPATPTLRGEDVLRQPASAKESLPSAGRP